MFIGLIVVPILIGVGLFYLWRVLTQTARDKKEVLKQADEILDQCEETLSKQPKNILARRKRTKGSKFKKRFV